MRVAPIGAGKFGAMFLAQARMTPGMQVAAMTGRVVRRPVHRPGAACRPWRATNPLVANAISYGMFVAVEAAENSAYARACFREYHMLPDSTGRYATLHRPVHLGGLELGISAAWAVLQHRDVPAGAALRWTDVAIDLEDAIVRCRRQMGDAFAPADGSDPEAP